MTVLAETNFQYSGDQSHIWNGYGLKLHVKKGSTANFKARVVHSTKFLLPEETELVSPIFWVTSTGETSGPVTVEIQHCVDIKKDEGLSDLGVAIYKVEKSEQTYRFSKADGHFSCNSSFGKIEMEFSGWLFALIITIKRMLGLEPKFQAKLYYKNTPPHLIECTAHLVIVPAVEACQVG